MNRSDTAFLLGTVSSAAFIWACVASFQPEPTEMTWELKGLHQAVPCEGCHPADQPVGPVSTACEDCHEDDRPVVHDPGPCGECHTEFGWDLIVFDHTFFPLTQSHDQECIECHTNGTYYGLDPTCSSCHEAERPDGHYEGQDCGDCHVPTTWDDADFDHSFFPLELSHDQPCESCHTDGTYEGLDPTCTSCHEDERPPGHFEGQDCGDCHVPTTWGDAVDIDHSFFPLQDGHDLDCTACHVDGDFTGLDPTCSSCHEPDRPPNHFEGVDCGECHTTTVWDDVDFDHDPYFHLPHEGVSDCGSCHLNPADYTEFSCIDCHEHRRSETDDEHDDVPGYVYNSEACLACHGINP